jgi:hypothetical protein
MKLCGWKTRAMLDRYNIVNETDLADGVQKLARFQLASSNKPSDESAASSTRSARTSAV